MIEPLPCGSIAALIATLIPYQYAVRLTSSVSCHPRKSMSAVRFEKTLHGVVVQHVKPPEPVEHEAHHRLQLLGPGHVGAKHFRNSAGSADFPGHALRPLQVAIDDHDLAALARIGFHAGFADSRSAAGDDTYFVRKSHRPLLPTRPACRRARPSAWPDAPACRRSLPVWCCS